MAHGHALRGRRRVRPRFQNLSSKGISAVTPSSEISLGAEIARLEHLLEEIGLHQALGEPAAVNLLLLRLSICAWIHSRRSR